MAGQLVVGGVEGEVRLGRVHHGSGRGGGGQCIKRQRQAGGSVSLVH